MDTASRVREIRTLMYLVWRDGDENRINAAMKKDTQAWTSLGWGWRLLSVQTIGETDNYCARVVYVFELERPAEDATA